MFFLVDKLTVSCRFRPLCAQFINEVLNFLYPRIFAWNRSLVCSGSCQRRNFLISWDHGFILLLWYRLIRMKSVLINFPLINDLILIPSSLFLLLDLFDSNLVEPVPLVTSTRDYLRWSECSLSFGRTLTSCFFYYCTRVNSSFVCPRWWILSKRRYFRLVSEFSKLFFLLLAEFRFPLKVDASRLGYQVVYMRTIEVRQLGFEGWLSQSLWLLTDVWLEQDCWWGITWLWITSRRH